MRGNGTSAGIERPRDLAEALTLLSMEPHPKPIAGGTDLFVAINDGRNPADSYLDMKPLSRELRRIRLDRAGLSIGAMTTYTDLRRSKDVAAFAPVLAAVSRDVGAIAIQNRGTIGGSLGNASPASDPAPVLLALDAVVELASKGATRTVPLSEFFLGYRKTAAKSSELITGVRIARESVQGFSIGYRKVGTRRAQAISKVVLATAVKLGKGGRVEAVRIAFGSVAATSLRARAAEAILLGETLDSAAIVRAQDALSADVKPIDDIRSTADYRMAVARNLLAAQLASVGKKKR